MTTSSITLEDAARRLRQVERVLVIGCSGSGKSRLSRRLASALDLRYISLDRDVFWLPGWKVRPRPEVVERLVDYVAQPCWIMDGTSPGTLPLRLPRSELVIWMRPPRLVSVWCPLAMAALSRPIAARDGRRMPGKNRPAVSGLCLELRADREPGNRGKARGIRGRNPCSASEIAG